jgi:uncharacterized protein (DUF362 family)
MKKSKVTVLRTTPETAVEDYQRLLELAGTREILDPSQATILKPNISWHFFYPSANTTPWQMEGTIKGLKNLGFENMTAVENDTVVTNPYKGERENKFNPILKEQKIPVLYNCRDEDMDWVPFQPKGELLALNRVFPEGVKVPDFFFGKNIVHLPTAKCHVYTCITGAMKNAFGGLVNTRRHYTHTWIHETLVDLLTIQKEIHPGILAVMDGTVAGDGPGPRTMRPVAKNLILASGDQVAIDAIAAKMMGFDPMNIPFIRMAHERGLGVGDPSEIEIAGEDISRENWQFSVGDNAATAFIRPFWWGWLSPLQKLFFRTPLVYFFVAGSYIFHDYIWYPIKGKRVIRKFLETEWGKKWLQYKK